MDQKVPNMKLNYLCLSMFSLIIFGLLEIIGAGHVMATSTIPSRFHDNMAIENWIIGNVKDGKVADLKFFSRKDKPLILKAAFIKTLITDKSFGQMIDYHGVCIENAIIIGKLDLEFADISNRVSLKNCLFQDFVTFKNSHFQKNLELDGTVFKENVVFEGMKVDYDFKADYTRFLANKDKLIFDGMIIGRNASFNNAIFYGTVSCVGADIGSQLIGNEAIFLESTTFNGLGTGKEVYFMKAMFYGPVNFGGSNIKGDFSVNGSMFLNDKEKTNFNNLVVGQNAMFAGTVFLGPVDFIGANIGGQLQIDKALFLKKRDEKQVKDNEVVNNFNGIKVASHAFIINSTFIDIVSIANATFYDLQFGKKRKGKSIDTTIDDQNYPVFGGLVLSYTVVDHDLSIKGIQVGSLEAKNIQVKGEALIDNVKVLSFIDFRLGNFHEIALNINHDDIKECSNDICLEKGIFVDGLRYDLIGMGRESTCPEKINCEKFLSIYNKADFNLANYKQLEDYFTRCGNEGLSNKVFIEGKERELSQRKSYDPLRWGIYIFWHKMVGNGRYPENAFLLSLVVILFGAVFYFNPDIIEKHDQTDWQWLSSKTLFKRCCFRLILSLDYFIPAVDLGVAKEIPISKVSFGTLLYLHLHKALGWVLIIIGLAAITSKLK